MYANVSSSEFVGVETIVIELEQNLHVHLTTVGGSQ